ncbi:MAG TPA: hypothetical protein VEH04_10525, partial [Verrucomicrobiae bacterium]|nr:hypothetical protein [Verrucomicrobiae bacterium]
MGFDLKHAGTNAAKCGHFEYHLTEIPPDQVINVYLVETVLTNISLPNNIEIVQTETNIQNGCKFVYPGTYWLEKVETLVVTDVFTIDYLTCEQTNVVAGTYFLKDEMTDDRMLMDYCDQSNVYDYVAGDRTYMGAGSGQINNTTNWSRTTSHSSTYFYSENWTPASNYNYTAGSTNEGPFPRYDIPEDHVDTQPTVRTITANAGPGATMTRTYTLSEPFDDDKLKGKLDSRIQLPSTWSDGDPASHFSWIASHGYTPANHYGASGSKSKYRIKIFGTERDVTYRVTWEERTIFDDGSTGKPNSITEEIQGTGNPTAPAVGTERTLEMPVKPGKTHVVITAGPEIVSNGKPGSGGPSGGSAGGGPGAGASGSAQGGGGGAGSDGSSGMQSATGAADGASCGSCNTGPDNFAGAGGSGPSFYVSMGTAANGESLGGLTFGQSETSAELFTPANLQFTAPSRGDVEVIHASNGTIRQVKTPNGLADVVDISTNSYRIDFYEASQVGALSTGVYSVTPPPFASWLITNSTAPDPNTVQVSEAGSLSSGRQWTYTYSTNTGVWIMVAQGGLLQTASASIPLGSGRYTVSNAVLSASGELVYVEKNTYQQFDWGVGLVETQIGPDSHAHKTHYTYDDYSPFPTMGSRQPLRWVFRHDGSWEYYNQYDSVGRPEYVYSSFGDVETNNYTAARETRYYYGSGHGDDGTLFPETARKVEERIAGQMVSSRYSLFPQDGVRLDVRGTSAASSGWNDASNLFTTNRYYTSGPNQYRMKAVVREDGTMITHDYSTNSSGFRTNIVVTGKPNNDYTLIVDGRSNRTVLNIEGFPIASITRDVARPHIILEQHTYGNFDQFGRAQAVTNNLTGTVVQTHYSSCCSYVESSVDADGVITTHTYDALKRQVASTRSGITTTNVLDAMGRVLRTTRLGGGDSIRLAEYSYDVTGHLIAHTNANGGKTAYIEAHDPATGGRIDIVLNPDGGTRTNFYYLDGSLKKVTGTAVHPVRYEYGPDADSLGNQCTYTKEIKLNNDGSDTSEWVQTFVDSAGRITEVQYPGDSYIHPSLGMSFPGPSAIFFYNNRGQLTNQIDPDGICTIYRYDDKGEQEYTVIDTNQNWVIDFSGGDRITRTVRGMATNSGVYVSRMETYVWETHNANTASLLSTIDTSVDGLQSWSTTWNGQQPVTSHSRTVYGTGGNRYHTNSAADGTYSVIHYQNGRMANVTRKAGSTVLSSVSYTYDSHGRRHTAEDARNGTTTFGYNDADQVVSVASPAAAPGQGQQVTVTHYNKMLQATNVVHPDGTSSITEYHKTGELKKTYGSRTYPVQYEYDYAGRMAAMTTWTNYATSGASVTRWHYHPHRGWLTNKVYADSTGPRYSYTPAGRLSLRMWARGVNTDYNYNTAGDLATVLYTGDNTPGVTNTYDRRGRIKTIWSGDATQSMAYNGAGQVVSETHTGGALSGMAVTNAYDSLSRRTAVGLNTQSDTLVNYGYGAGSRLASVANSSTAAAYTYVAKSSLVEQIAFSHSSQLRMTTTRSHDFLNRLTGISSVTPGNTAPPITHAYDYNPANQRTRAAMADGSYWIYEYDSLGQVTSGRKFWADGTPVAGQQFEYVHDDIGNRRRTRSGGDETGGQLRQADYTVTAVNQYTSRGVPASVDIMGISYVTNTVTVNGGSTYRKGEFFRREWAASVPNSGLWTNITVAASGQAGTTGNVFIAKSPETFGYDLDGNLTNDGRWAFTWDAENRLTKLESLTNGPSASKRRVVWMYDGKGRRVRQTTYDLSSGPAIPIEDLKFVNDG